MSRGIIRLAYVLLALMSLASFGGPFLIGTVLRGGESPTWPPDRPVEWGVVAGVTGVVVVVLIGLSILWLANMRQLKAARVARESMARSEADRGGA